MAPSYDIPKTCKAGVVVNEGPDFRVEVQDVPVPEIGPEDVLIKLNATGICHSDLHYMMADWGMGKMSDFGTRCAGHEGAGVIVKVGEQVKKLKVGQRAGLKPIWDTCGSCELCRTDKECYCADAQFTGLHVAGSYQQYVASPERYTTIIPEGVSDEVAGPIMCSASTIYTSLKTSGLRPGQWAVFPGGGGGVGIQGVQLAEAMGLRPIVVDTGAERKALALKLGAEVFVDFRESKDAVAEVVKITDGIGAHGVFVTAPQAYPLAQGYLGSRVGGVVMCIALPSAGTNNMTVVPAQMAFRNQCIKGTLVSNMGDVDETLKFAMRGKLRLEPKVVGLSGWNDACQDLKNGKVAGRIVVDFNRE
ncbi:alcohol dehydrogenase 1 [Trichodelitschia bisporula]|uniref:Alcohol dehydrogenase 1 n=1 Tax=Trichodelitschia bisporula TaxID=703511 RepID=A0A6G1IA56_9PEZI|nr:alcohol dehydrogenase 1 [Trichodelitschia bisporula]